MDPVAERSAAILAHAVGTRGGLHQRRAAAEAARAAANLYQITDPFADSLDKMFAWGYIVVGTRRSDSLRGPHALTSFKNNPSITNIYTYKTYRSLSFDINCFKVETKNAVKLEI